MVRVCIDAPNGYAVFGTRSHLYFSEHDVVAWRLARMLNDHPDFFVQLVTGNYGTASEENFDGVSVCQSTYANPQIWSYRESLKWALRRTLEKIKNKCLAAVLIKQQVMVKQLSRHFDANPDIIIVFNAGTRTKNIIEIAKKRGCLTVLIVNNEIDFWRNIYSGSAEYTDTNISCSDIYECLVAADLVVATTTNARKIIKQIVTRRVACLPAPMEFCRTDRTREYPGGEFVLWIGGFDGAFDHPSIAVEIARRLPDVRIKIAVRELSWTFVDWARRSAPAAKIEFLSLPSREEIDELWSGAAAYIYTSCSKRFPDAFLRAGKHGVPIVSLFDENSNFVANTSSGSIDTLVRNIEELLASTKGWDEASHKVAEIVRSQYVDMGAVNQWASALGSLHAGQMASTSISK